MSLTDKRIDQAKPKAKEYALADSHGLMVVVKPNGKKYWIHRFYIRRAYKCCRLGNPYRPGKRLNGIS